MKRRNFLKQAGLVCAGGPGLLAGGRSVAAEPVAGEGKPKPTPESTASSNSAAQRGADWLLGMMEPDGSLRGGTNVMAYYKPLLALASTGRLAETDRMLDYVVRRFLKNDGDLDGSGCPGGLEQVPTYLHSWILMAAALRARFDLVMRIAGHLERFYEPATGGYYVTIQDRSQQGRQELTTTSFAALAMLFAGRVELAKGTGAWLRRLYDAQPDLKRGLYTYWDRRDGLVTKVPTENPQRWFVDAGKTRQHYYQYGAAAVFLSSLSAATGDSAWLDLAQQYLHASRHCREDVYQFGRTCKIGWGAAWTYRLTHDPDDRRLIEVVQSALEDLQQPGGWWGPLADCPQLEKAKPKPCFEVSGEFIAELGWMECALE